MGCSRLRGRRGARCESKLDGSVLRVSVELRPGEVSCNEDGGEGEGVYPAYGLRHGARYRRIEEIKATVCLL